jgi:hypothetical protein
MKQIILSRADWTEGCGEPGGSFDVGDGRDMTPLMSPLKRSFARMVAVAA